MNKWCNKVRLVVEDSYIGSVSRAAKGGDCKSPDFGLRWFESNRSHCKLKLDMVERSNTPHLGCGFHTFESCYPDFYENDRTNIDNDSCGFC